MGAILLVRVIQDVPGSNRQMEKGHNSVRNHTVGMRKSEMQSPATPVKGCWLEGDVKDCNLRFWKTSTYLNRWINDVNSVFKRFRFVQMPDRQMSTTVRAFFLQHFIPGKRFTC